MIATSTDRIRLHGARPSGRVSTVVAVVAALVLASCSGSPSTATTTAPAPSTTPAGSTSAGAAAWAPIARSLGELGRQTSLLAARVGDDRTCAPVHAEAATTVRPIASQFKLFVLGALAEAVAAGDLAWAQQVAVPDVRSLGNEGVDGALQAAPAGAEFPLEHVATQMIAISDNTATDLLIDLVGRGAVEDQFARWSDHADRNTPLLTTREMLLLHYAEGLGEQYLATPPDEQTAFLDDQVAPRSNAEIATGFTTEPRFIEQIEWFATAQDVCRAFAGLHRLAAQPGLNELDPVLAAED